jgi:hypothetical protein
MHDTDEYYFDVRKPHDRRMEYVRKKGQHCIFTPMIGGWNMYEKHQAEDISTN